MDGLLTRQAWVAAVNADIGTLREAATEPSVIVTLLEALLETKVRNGLVKGYPRFGKPGRGISFAQWERGAGEIHLDLYNEQAGQAVLAALEKLTLISVSRITNCSHPTNDGSHFGITIILEPFQE